MESRYFFNNTIAKFKNIKVVTKVWKAKVVLPFSMSYSEEEENESKSVWLIQVVLN